MATSASRAAPEPPTLRSSPRLASRLLLLVALAVLAVMVLRSGMAFVVRPADPALALRFAPGNADVLESRAEQLVRLDPSPANRNLAEAYARKALARSPVAAAGARMLATTRDMAGDANGARRLMIYAEGLSRRDLPTELWFIEDAVRRNDVRGALHHYDIALRGTVTTPPLLFPVLIGAIAQPAVVEGLIDTLAPHPVWGDPFLLQASRDAGDLDGLAALMIGLARRGYILPPSAIAQASGRMVDAGRYDKAWQLFVASHPPPSSGAVRDPDFARLGLGDTPFEWIAIGTDNIRAEPRAYGAGARLAYSAPTGVGGATVRQLIRLPSGTFVLSGRGYNVAAGSKPATLGLSCAGTGAPVASIATPVAGAPGLDFAGRFVIPAKCPAQWLQVFVEGGDNPGGSSGELSGVRIMALGRGA